MTNPVYVDDNQYVDEDKYEEIKKEDFLKALFIASRVTWGITGAMVLLMFLNERLYLENEMFPYAAKLGVLVFLIFAAFFDACYLHKFKEKSV